jgi:hypothetical protein
MANPNQDYADLIEALIQAANAAAARNVPPPAPIIPPVVVPPNPFALVPGQANDDPLDYSKPGDVKLFHRAIKGLEPKFDLKESSLQVFLSKVKEQARIFNWASILEIPDKNGTARNLVTNYGQVTIENCKTHSLTYIAAQSRQAQNSMMMFQCLTGSLTEEASVMMLSNPEAYTVNSVPSGPCFLKAIIGKASIDSNAKVFLLRETLANLHLKMNEYGGDVRRFNVFVDNTRINLAGRGESVDELTTHLFKAYEQVNDAKFQHFIQNLRDKADMEGDVTSDQLMQLALNKYDLIKHRGEIESITTNDSKDKIFALEAEVQALKATATTSRQRNNQPRTIPAWKKKKPANGESQVKQVKGRNYHWCPNHQMWTVHSPSDCTFSGKTSPGNNQKGDKKVKEEDDDKLVLTKAYSAIIASSDESDD